MTIRGRVKRWLYGSCPGFAGSFPYFGTRVYFPTRSIIFDAACQQGIYEQPNLRAILSFLRDGSHVLDVGANIGLMSVPVLASNSGVKLVSYEPSPDTLRFLARTRQGSAFADRWEVVGKAVGAAPGISKFSLGPVELGVFDSLKSTGRAAVSRVVDVDVTTIDAEWHRLGRPDVSVIKIDVEGAEYEVLQGATECIDRCRPAVVAEWSPLNIGAYGRSLDELLMVAEQLRYRIWALPHLAEIRDPTGLRVQASVTESFLLVAGP